MPLPLHDAHNHLQDPSLAPHLDAILADCRAAGVGSLSANGTCEADWPVLAALAGREPLVRPSFGLHPWDARSRSGDWLDRLRETLSANPAAGVGEVGLDRMILERAGQPGCPVPAAEVAPWEEQLSVFAEQLALAVQLERPVSIHAVRCAEEMEAVLASRPRPARGFLLHAYGGPPDRVPTLARLGAYFSFNGSFLGERARLRREAFRAVPPDRLLVETDAPALPPPSSWRTWELPPSPEGRAVNHPANIASIYRGLASVLGWPWEDLVSQVDENHRRLFGPSAGSLPACPAPAPV